MRKFQITFKGQVYELDVEEISAETSGAKKTVSAPTPVPASPVQVTTQEPKAAHTAIPTGAQTILAPLPGKIMSVNVKQGDYIKRGDVICILEAMKMQNEIMATHDGKVAEVRVVVGQMVSTGNVIVIMA